MSAERKAAVWIGVLYIIGTVALVLSAVVTGAVLAGPAYPPPFQCPTSGADTGLPGGTPCLWSLASVAALPAERWRATREDGGSRGGAHCVDAVMGAAAGTSSGTSTGATPGPVSGDRRLGLAGSGASACSFAVSCIQLVAGSNARDHICPFG